MVNALIALKRTDENDASEKLELDWFGVHKILKSRLWAQYCTRNLELKHIALQECALFQEGFNFHRIL